MNRPYRITAESKYSVERIDNPLYNLLPPHASHQPALISGDFSLCCVINGGTPPTMENLLERIVSSPVNIGIAVVILAVLGFAIFKRLAKLILVAVVLLAVYIGYIHFTGGDPREAAKTAVEKAKDAAK